MNQKERRPRPLHVCVSGKADLNVVRDRVISIPSLFASVLSIIALSFLPLSLSPHLLQLLAVLPLNEALLMGHLREVIWNTTQQMWS